MVGMYQDENSAGDIKHVKPLSPLERVGLGKEKQYFMENLAMLFATDMDIVYAFEAIKTGMKSKPMRRLMEGVIYEIKSGAPIWKTLEKTGLFKDSTISLIKIGEQTGKLPENLKVVVDQQEKQRVFGSKMKSAMMYPLLIFSVMIIVGTGVAWFILPKLGMVFESLDLELPLPTRILLAVGSFLSDYGFIAVPVFLIVLLLLFFIVFVNKGTKHIGQAILIRFPVLKQLILATELARFAYIFSTLLNSGISILLALDILTESASYPRFRKLYQAMRVGVEDGKSFEIIFKEYKKSHKAIPTHIQHMIAAAEKSGLLEKTLQKVSKVYEEKIEILTKNFTTLIEPLMLVMVFGGVVTLALAVITPIYGLIGNLGSVGKTTAKPTPVAQNTPDEGPQTPKVKKLQVMKFPNEKTNIMSERSFYSKVLLEAKPKEIFEYTAVKENWYKVKLEGKLTPEGDEELPKFGWIQGKYIILLS